MRGRIIVAAAMVALVCMLMGGPTRSADPSQQIIDDCKAASTVDSLKQCVDKLLELRQLEEKGRDTYMALVAECATSTSIEAMRECILLLTGTAPTMLKPDPSSPSKDVPTPPARRRTWELSESESRMDGSAQVVLFLLSDDEVLDGYGARSRPILYLRCAEGKTSLFIVGEAFLGSDVPVQWRIDKDRPVSQTWPASTNSKAAGLWDGARAIPFIKSLFGRETLLVRITPYRDTPKEAAYNIAGLEKAITPLRKACKW